MARQLVIAAFWADMDAPGQRKSQEVADALKPVGIFDSAGAVVTFNEETIDGPFRSFMRAIDLAEVIDAKSSSTPPNQPSSSPVLEEGERP